MQGAAAVAPRTPTVDVDGELFQRLRVLRKRFSESQGIPAYMVFSDVTLKSIAAERPRTREELLGISGVGEKKLDLYGKAFLEAIHNSR